MLIDTTDTRFIPELEDHVSRKIDINDFYGDDFSLYEDNELLAAANSLPRFIGKTTQYLEEILEEISTRDILEPVPDILLEERTDDWLGERRAELKAQIATLTKQQEALAAERDEIDAEFFARFTTRGTSGTRTTRFTISAKQDDHYPEVEDRTEFEEYLLKTGKLHLLQKRLSMTAIREELDAMEQQKEIYLAKLEESNWNIDTCRYILLSIAEDNETEELIENKLAIFQATNTIKNNMKNILDQYYRVPGIGISTKLTLNQVKRGK